MVNNKGENDTDGKKFYAFDHTHTQIDEYETMSFAIWKNKEMCYMHVPHRHYTTDSVKKLQTISRKTFVNKSYIMPSFYYFYDINILA